MKKTWYEKQKDLCDTAASAYKWIKEKLKKGDVDDGVIVDDLVFALKRLEWSLGGIGIGNFVHGHGSFQERDPLGMWAPFYELHGPDQTWAWEVFRMSCIRFPEYLPVIILLAKKQVTQKGVAHTDIIDPSDEDIKFIQDIQCHRDIVQGEYLAESIIDVLQKDNLLCEVDGRLYATVVDGFGTGPLSYSLFDAGSMAEVALDEFQCAENLADDEKLSVLIRNLGIRLTYLESPLRKNYIMRGKELLDRARENYLRKLNCGGHKHQKLVKEKEAENRNRLLGNADGEVLASSDS